MKRQGLLFGLILVPLIGSTSDAEIQSTSSPATETKSNQADRDCAGSSASNAVRRRVSIVPQFSATTIHAAYWPVLTQIGEQANLCFELIQQPSIPEFEDVLRSRQADYAFMNPYHQVMFKSSYRPLVRDKKKLLTGILVTNRNSEITTVRDLEGRDLLLPAPNAFAASLLTRAFLDKQGVKVKPRYVKTHQNVYRGVARDKNAAVSQQNLSTRVGRAAIRSSDSHGNTRLSCPSILSVPNNSVKRKHDGSDSMDRNGATNCPETSTEERPDPLSHACQLSERLCSTGGVRAGTFR